MTISTDTKGPGWAWGCRYNRGTLEVRGYTPVSTPLRSFSFCQQFLTVPLRLNHKEETNWNGCKNKNTNNNSSFSGPLTLSVCWWMEPEWWRSWTEARAGPAGSLCWYHGCPSVSGNAGAGLGLPGHAVRCSAARRKKQAEVKNLWRVLPGKLYFQHNSCNYNCLSLGSIHPAWMGNENLC